MRKRILILKLDHRGDFLIGLPALQRLRAIFPDDHLTLVCAAWNRITARDLGVADEVRVYDYFPEVSHGWSGEPVESIERFQECCRGRFDIAIDLRVDEDTRPLLRHVDAALRCGIGSRKRHPYLNILLSDQFEIRETRTPDTGALVFGPDAFHSRMPIRTTFFHETDFTLTNAHLVYGPYARLPMGKLRAEFAFQLAAPILSRHRVEIVVEVAGGGDGPRIGSDVLGRKRVRRVPNLAVTVVDLEFTNDDPTARYEFRVFVGGRPRRARLRFFGAQIRLLEAAATARYSPAELHIGEQLSLLVQLIAERVPSLYAPDLVDRISGNVDIAVLAPERTSDRSRCIIISPLSNKTARDWPLDKYARLIGMLLREVDCNIVLVGSPEQTEQLTGICQHYGDDRRLTNLAGQTDWSQLAALLRHCDLVIANNSGVAHLAAACGRPTLAIYSGTHQPQEWGPRGDAVRVVMAVVPCSPCGYDRVELCPNDFMCMNLIEPETVFHHAVEMLETDVGIYRSTCGSSGSETARSGLLG